MRLIKLLAILLVIKSVASKIYFKGDCNASQALENSDHFPTWSSCMAFKNGNNRCGEDSRSPAQRYGNILSKESWFLRYASPFSCKMDDDTVDTSSTVNIEDQKIVFNSETVIKYKDIYPDYLEYNFVDKDSSHESTSGSWIYGDLEAYIYHLNVNKFEVPGCNDCTCGSLEIYAMHDTYEWNATSIINQSPLLVRICSHNVTKELSFKSLNPKPYQLLIQFQTNVILPKKLEIDLSSTPIDKWTQCAVNCGEGFKTRKIISSEKCNAIQYRSCWVGKCTKNERANLEISSHPVGNKCLNLMEETQEKFHSKLHSVNKNCWYFLDEYGLLNQHAKSQIYDGPRSQGKCKANATTECKMVYLNFLTFWSDLIKDEELKNCYNPRMVKNPVNEFLSLTVDSMENLEAFEMLLDRANQTCKFL